ncbi:DNL zinc finger-domain-containing protein [Aspergillus karnatakaensis]|uniref:DNL-type zinc finger protein n=1 Tax=Aspergillus karnatakaensis TaxID=1810916 RepID=UPI003CCCA30E
MRSSLRLSQGLRALNSACSQSSLPRGASRFCSQLSRQSSRPFRQTYLSQTPKLVIPSISIRHNSNESASKRLTDHSPDPETDAENEAWNQERRQQEPQYVIVFTCKPCGERSWHRMSKQGYHRGTILIQCPGCKNRHVISDNLGIFYDKRTNLEDLLEQNKDKITRGQIDGEDVEFWDDGTLEPVKTDGHVDETERIQQGSKSK